MSEISFDKFRYWLISIDVLEKPPELDKQFFFSNNQQIRLDRVNVFWYELDDNLVGSNSIRRVELNEEVEGISFIYLYVVNALNERIIVSISEINCEQADKIIGTDWQEVNRFQKSLLWETHYPELLGKNVKSIFYKSVQQGLVILDLPLIMYCEPRTEERITFKDDVDLSQKIDHLMNENDSLFGWFEVLRPYSMLCPITLYNQKKSAILINTEPMQRDDQNLYFPYLLQLFIQQIAITRLTKHRMHQIDTCKLANFNADSFQNASINDIAKQNDLLMNAVYEFNDIHISILNEIGEIREIDFTMNHYLRRTWNFELNSNGIVPSFFKVVSDIDILQEQTRRIDFMGGILSNYSRGMIDVKSAILNLSLQKRLVNLTWVISLLTIIILLLTAISVWDNSNIHLIWDSLINWFNGLFIWLKS